MITCCIKPCASKRYSIAPKPSTVSTEQRRTPETLLGLLLTVSNVTLRRILITRDVNETLGFETFGFQSETETHQDFM